MNRLTQNAMALALVALAALSMPASLLAPSLARAAGFDHELMVDPEDMKAPPPTPTERNPYRTFLQIIDSDPPEAKVEVDWWIIDLFGYQPNQRITREQLFEIMDYKLRLRR